MRVGCYAQSLTFAAACHADESRGRGEWCGQVSSRWCYVGCPVSTAALLCTQHQDVFTQRGADRTPGALERQFVGISEKPGFGNGWAQGLVEVGVRRGLGRKWTLPMIESFSGRDLAGSRMSEHGWETAMMLPATIRDEREPQEKV